jgi:hypothetical protein
MAGFRGFRSILFVALLGLAASCGPATPLPGPAPYGPPASPAKAALVVGDPQNLTSNKLTFAPVTKGKKDTKELIFTAPSDGKLTTDAGVLIIIFGWGCSGDAPTGQASFLKADPATGAFTIEAQADPALVPDDFAKPKVSLKAGEKLDIRVELEGQSDCDYATVEIGAGFQGQ